MPKDVADEVAEIKTRKRKTARNPDHFYQRNAQDFHDGSTELTLPARGAYNGVVDLMYIYGGPLKDDDFRIAGMLIVKQRAWRAARKELLAKDKLFLRDGYLHNERVDDELAKRKAQREARAARVAQRPACDGSANDDRPVNEPSATDDRPVNDASSESPEHENEGSVSDINGGGAQSGTPTAPYACARYKLDSGEVERDSEEEKEDAPRVTFENGQIKLFGQLLAYWLGRFENDADRLELGLLQATGYIQHNSSKPLEAQVSAQLARQCADKRDRDQRSRSRQRTTSNAEKRAADASSMLAIIEGGLAA